MTKAAAQEVAQEVAISTVSPSAICQIEIPVSDVQASLQFYEHVFGWRRSPAEIQECIVLETQGTGADGAPPDDSRTIGVSLIPGAAAPGRSNHVGAHSHIVLYFKVGDPEGIVRRAVAYGGSKRFGPRKMPSYGEIWRITDPDGNQLGHFKAGVAGLA